MNRENFIALGNKLYVYNQNLKFYTTANALGQSQAKSLKHIGCLPFTQKIRKFRMECKWKD